MVGFKGIRQSYHCRVDWNQLNHTISIEYLSGPLADLFTRWEFSPVENAKQPACMVDFQLRFALRNRLLDQMMNQLMLGAIERMTDAFVHRAHALYGSKASSSETALREQEDAPNTTAS